MDIAAGKVFCVFQKLRFVIQKVLLITLAMISVAGAIVFGMEKRFSMPKKIVSGVETIVFVAGKIGFIMEKIGFVTLAVMFATDCTFFGALAIAM